MHASLSVWMVKSDVGTDQFPAGSAVAIAPHLLVSACHVVTGALAVTVTQQDKQFQVLRITRDPDPARDLCLLEVAADVGLVPIVIAPMDTVRVGQPVFAIGSPHGLEMTLSEGLVSALRPAAEGQLPIIQTSAALSAGSSGGGLFDTEARLIGITDNVSPGGENLGFALPAEWVSELPARIAAELVERHRLLASLDILLAPGGEPLPSGHAAIDDMRALLPLAVGQDSAAMQLAYQQFLLQALPRAFMITGDGYFGAITSAASLLQQLAHYAAQQVGCAVYAVDNTVVWGGQKARV